MFIRTVHSSEIRPLISYASIVSQQGILQAASMAPLVFDMNALRGDQEMGFAAMQHMQQRRPQVSGEGGPRGGG
eukprot:1974072-Pyramimonas_sp.AAC.1